MTNGPDVFAIACFFLNHNLQRVIGLDRHSQRINTGFGQGGVGGAAVETDLHRNTGGHIVTHSHTHLTGGNERFTMGGHHTFYTIHDTVVNHHFCAADGTFLAGLEHQANIAGEVFFMLF